MSLTAATLFTNFNKNIKDQSTDVVTDAERYAYLTEATVWLKTNLSNDHEIETYNLKYYDTLYNYKVTTSIADLLEVADLRRAQDDHRQSFAHKSSKELAEEIGQGATESSYAIERRDGNSYLVVNHDSKYYSKLISDFETVTDGGGTWAVDATNSDATNLTIDTNQFQHGNGCINFDITVSQSANNRATIINSAASSIDMTADDNLSSFIFELDLPSVINFSSVTFYWGSDSSNYYSATVTSDYNGNPFVIGNNTIKIDWQGSTKTGTPDVTAIDYYRIDLNYTGSQTNATDYRIDYLRLVRPENLRFYYVSWKIGTTAAGADLFAYTAASDVPYYSGQYDQYQFPIAHKAAQLCLMDLTRYADADRQEAEAIKALKTIQDLVPSSRTPEVKSFKPTGVNFARRGRSRRR